MALKCLPQARKDSDHWEASNMNRSSCKISLQGCLLLPHALLGFGAAAHGKFVTFGVTRGLIAVASPVSSITWLISP